MNGVVLELVVQKTKATFFTKCKKKFAPQKIAVDGFEISFTKSMQHLGIQIDNKLKFTTHVDKPAHIVGELTRLMPNVPFMRCMSNVWRKLVIL